jgi:hypothetical protein
MTMDTREETARPMGVLACLLAGFDLVSRHLWLAVLPILLDLFLWLGPRISIQPLIERVADLLRSQAASPADGAQVTFLVTTLAQVGERYNLFSVLGGVPFLTVPSLLARDAPGMLSPLGDAIRWSIRGILPLASGWLLFLPAGLVLGFVYMASVARSVRAMHGTVDEEPARSRLHDDQGAARFIDWLLRLVRYLVFAGAVLVMLVFMVPSWLYLTTLGMSIGQIMGSIVMIAGFVMGAYMLTQFAFVIHGVLLGGRGLLRAAWESFILVRTQFIPVIGMLLTIALVQRGLQAVWTLPGANSWALLIGIVGNACVSTGLVAATFIFYRDRLNGLVAYYRQRTSTRNRT